MVRTQKIFFPGRQFICLNFSLTEYRTYFVSLLLVFGSVAAPYILHRFSLAGQIFLPIYFFILLGAYKFGWRAGIMTAVLSPLISFGLSGMPVPLVLPFVILKGGILAVVAGFIAGRSGKLSVLGILFAVFAYQAVGSLIIYLFTYDINLALMDLKLGYPGLLLQIIGGYVLLDIARESDFRNFHRKA